MGNTLAFSYQIYELRTTTQNSKQYGIHFNNFFSLSVNPNLQTSAFQHDHEHVKHDSSSISSMSSLTEVHELY